MIELHGLTAHQCDLLDIIWTIDSMPEALEWISTLSMTDQQQCFSLIELIDLEFLDSKVKLMAIFPEASAIIKHVRSL